MTVPRRLSEEDDGAEMEGQEELPVNRPEGGREGRLVVHHNSRAGRGRRAQSGVMRSHLFSNCLAASCCSGNTSKTRHRAVMIGIELDI